MIEELAAAPAGGASWLRAALGLAKSPRALRLARAVTVGAAAWEIGKQVHAKGKQHVTYTVTLPSSDDAYEAAHAWLLEHVKPARRRALTARSSRTRSDSGLTSEPGGGPYRHEAGLRLFYDGARAQTVRIGGHRVTVGVQKEGLPGNVTLSASEQGWFRALDQLVFTAYGTAARDAVVEHLRALAQTTQERPTPRFYIATQWSEWRRLNDLPSRRLDTVILRDGQAEGIVGDLEKFLASETTYSRVGLPWHRGYLFHGPPGTGKTSLARSLAEHFGLDVHYIPLSDMKSDTNLLNMFGSVDARSMLVLEDVDVVHAAKSRDDSESAGISLSGLLNALDGFTTPHGLVTVMTTNDLAALDPALVRAGRADVVEELGYLDDEQLGRLARLVGEPPRGLHSQHQDLPSLDGVDLTHAEIVEAAKPHLDQPEVAWEAVRHRALKARATADVGWEAVR